MKEFAVTSGLTWTSFVGAVSLLGILLVLSIAALAQNNHDALVALISVLTGAGIGVGTMRTSGPSQ